ncbi:MAG: hypothetical protein J6S98_07790 [Lentisphaeria bacterium]|nr:hypothetical protein [Lentisphaeria bacterium]
MMKKMVKFLCRLIAWIIALVLIALVALLIFIDPIIKGVVENFGPEIAGVRFELESISVSLFRGRVEIKNLYMYNPEGFNSEYAVKLGDVAMETEVMSWIGKKKGIIREIRLRDVTVNYETPFPNVTDSNIQAILDNVKSAAGQPEQQPEPAQQEQPEQQPEPAPQEQPEQQPEPAPQEQPVESAAEPVPADDGQRRFQLDKLIIENVQLAVVVKNKPEIRIPITVTLPDMGPVGTDEKGLTGTEIAFALASQIVRGLTNSVIQSSDQIYRDGSAQGMKIADDVKTHVKNYEESVKDTVKTWKSGDKAEAIRKGQEVLDNVLKDEKIKETGKDLKNLWDNLRGK